MTEEMREYHALVAELAPNPYDACAPMFGYCQQATVYPTPSGDAFCSAPLFREVFLRHTGWIAHYGAVSVAIVA